MTIMTQEAKKNLGCVLHWTGQIASANAPKSITAVGDVKQILPFSGAGIGMFDGDGDILTCGITSDWSFLAGGTWTVECWFYVSSYGDFTFISTYDSDTYTTLHYRCANTGKIAYGLCAPTGGWWNLNNWYGSGTYLLNAWNHVAMVRNGNDSNSTIQCFLNGVLDKTFNIGNTLLRTPTSPLVIGSYCPRYPTYFNGYMSEIRVSNIARYTTNFTPPRRQLESDEHTKLLLHFNRNDTTFVDSSPSAHTITAYGNAKQLCSPCGSGVAYFDGTGDYLTIPDSDDWFFGTSDFTIELWYCPTILPTSTNGSLFEIRTTEYASPLVILHDFYSSNVNKYAVMFSWDWTADRAMKSTTLASVGRWDHVALVRQGSTFKLYVNGIAESTYNSSNSIGNSGDPLYIGGIPFRATASISGFISGYCITKGISRYSGESFIPSTQPFKPDPYTKLLLHMDGVGNAFYDASDASGDNGFLILPDGVAVTPNGTFSSVRGKDGRSYLKFDGSTNYITFGANNNLTYFGTNDFTLCAWVYSSVFNSATMRIFGISDYLAANVWWTFGVGYNAVWGSNAINVGVTTGYATYADITAANVLTNNTWNHVVFVVRNGSPEMYCNGSRCTITTNTVSANWSYNAVSSLYIGNARSFVGELMNGYIKDAMIFKKALTVDQIGAIMDETYIF